MDPEQLGAALAENVRNLRDARGLTQGQLAERAGVPRATLSLLESGSANPTLSVLLRVCGALDVRIEELLMAPASDTVVFRKADLPVKKRGGVTVRKLLPESLSGVDFEELLLPAGKTLVGVPHTPGTREYLFVDTGRICLNVGGSNFELEAGDVAVFRGHQRHSYRNPERTPARGLSVIAQGRL